MKKIFICLLLMFVLVLTGCDDIKQAISDYAEDEIEAQVNEMLELTEDEELFQLPEATRYEEFAFDDNDPDKTTLSLAIIEPKITVEEYSEQMIEILLNGFEEEVDEEELNEEIVKFIEDKIWTYEYDGDTYTVKFEEVFSEDGETIEKWLISFEVVYGDYAE